ncbi:MAG: NUDIX hydrolase [Tepidiformaceae bacterium]
MSFELSAAVALFRGEELLVMKRAGGFSAGGWFMPGGHLEHGERPDEACARELFEETGIALEPAALVLADVMTYDTGGATAHCLIYVASCCGETECAINEEHVTARWLTPEAYIARFLDGERLRGLGASESALALAAEVARVVRAAERQRALSPGF